MILLKTLSNVRFPDEQAESFDEREAYDKKISSLQMVADGVAGVARDNYLDTLKELELRWKEIQSGLSRDDLRKRWEDRANQSKKLKNETTFEYVIMRSNDNIFKNDKQLVGALTSE
jgi:hypothetical protein